MPSSHLILCRPLLLLPPIPPSIRVFSNESTLPWGGQSTGVSALASFSPKKSQGWSPSEWTGWISLEAKGLSWVFSNTTVQKHKFFGAQPYCLQCLRLFASHWWLAEYWDLELAEWGGDRCALQLCSVLTAKTMEGPSAIEPQSEDTEASLGMCVYVKPVSFYEVIRWGNRSQTKGDLDREHRSGKMLSGHRERILFDHGEVQLLPCENLRSRCRK